LSSQEFNLKVSSALTAAILFLTLNFALPASTQIGRKAGSNAPSGDLIQRSLAQAVTRLDTTFTKQTASSEKPVVLIGSSLIIAPLWSADVRYEKFAQDSMVHHESKFLKRLLGRAGCQQEVVSLATAGQFVSDTFLIVDKYLKGPTKPDVLVYGIAPRDFMDDTTGGLALTSIFDGLVSLEDFPHIAPLFFTSFNEKADFALNRLVFLYRKRGRYQVKLNETMEKAAYQLTHALGVACVKSNTTPTEVASGFLVGGNRKDIWTKSIEEYSRRYKHFNQDQFAKQKECFQALLKLCKERRIKLYVVAMPLTADNQKLMPEGLFEKYKDCLATTCKANQIPYLDLLTNSQYGDDDFYDTVHLTYSGGEKFLKTVSHLVLQERAKKLAESKHLANTKAPSPAF
jgi:hypothetical protein